MATLKYIEFTYNNLFNTKIMFFLITYKLNKGFNFMYIKK